MSFSDINECAENNGGCEQNCTNSVGSYSCMCGDGYTLSDDGSQCDGEPIHTRLARGLNPKCCNTRF